MNENIKTNVPGEHKENKFIKDTKFFLMEVKYGRYYSQKDKKYEWFKSSKGQVWLNETTPCSGICVNLYEIVDLVPKNVSKDERWVVKSFNSTEFPLKDRTPLEKHNMCIVVDLDLDKSEKLKRIFEHDKDIYNKIYEYFDLALRDFLEKNYMYAEQSSSKVGIHAIFGFDIEANEVNFRKLAKYVKNKIFENVDNYIKGFSEVLNEDKVFDKIYDRPYQKYFITGVNSKFNDNCTGHINLDELETITIKEKTVDKVKDNVVDFINYSLEQKDIKEVYYEHPERMKIYTALVACYGTKEETDKAWANNIVPLIEEKNGHDKKFYLDEPNKNRWYERYDTKYVNEYWLEKFGYSFKKRFVPEKIDLYVPDILIELEDDKKLSDVVIPFKRDKINHLYAGCGVGKTYMSKVLGSNVDDIDFIFNKQNRVCFIAPLNSISKNSFEGVDGWAIIDSDHKESFDIRSTLNNKWTNICTTWESFVLYEMYNIQFDYVILDEVHSFYMYDYRVDSISQIKSVFPKAIGTKIIMTGTPSYEINEFDCYKIQVKRQDKKIKCDVVLYNKEYKGYIIKDIKSWTSDPNHLVLIFKDTTNYTTEDDFVMYGLNVDIFNKSYDENKEYILTNNNVRSQITAFSVYGQAGINLYLDADKKARVYILSKNGLGIIQYANRIRNKEVIDKIVVPYKIDEISSDVIRINDDIDIEEAKHRVNILKSIKKDTDIFTTHTESFLKLRYGMCKDCVNWNMMELNEPNYTTYKRIKNVAEYEQQLQVIYNRMISAFFEVNFVELTEDVKFSGDTKMRTNQFAGQMVRFNEEMVNEGKTGLWVKTTPEFDKVVTGNLKSDITDILNYIYNANNKDFDKTIEIFKEYISNIIRKKDTIKKSDIGNIKLFYELESNWSRYYNSAFLSLMLNDKWDDVQIASVYMRVIWNDEMNDGDWKALAEESYQKLSRIRKVVIENKSIFENLERTSPSEQISFENDELMGEIYGYLKKKHSRGRIKTITVKGINFNSVQDAAKYFNVRRETITRWLKSAK